MRKAWLPVFALVIAVGSCQKQKRGNGNGTGGGTGSGDGAVLLTKGGVPPGKPAYSRPTAIVCSKDRPPGEVTGEVDNKQCDKDADCADGGINGRCNVHHGGHGMMFASCDYDRCFADSDCGGGVCECHPGGNHCTPKGNCLIDADCGPGGFCSPSNGDDPEGACYSQRTYFCRTPKDECVSDSDCQKAGAGGKTCTFGRQVGHWLCIENTMCPIG